jgi:hypothetical protein
MVLERGGATNEFSWGDDEACQDAGDDTISAAAISGRTMGCHRLKPGNTDGNQHCAWL